MSHFHALYTRVQLDTIEYQKAKVHVGGSLEFDISSFRDHEYQHDDPHRHIRTPRVDNNTTMNVAVSTAVVVKGLLCVLHIEGFTPILNKFDIFADIIDPIYNYARLKEVYNPFF